MSESLGNESPRIDFVTDPSPSCPSEEVNALRLEPDSERDREPGRESDRGEADAPPLSAVPPPPRAMAPARPDFRAIFDHECGYVWNALRRLGVHERDLEDVAHDVFVTVHRRLDDYDPKRPIRPWLFGISYRIASDYRRLARHRREVVSDAFDPADERPSQDEQVEAAQARRLVAQALEALELDRRAVFVMHELDGHAMPEIARALSIPLNTAYSRLRLAREQFAISVKRLAARRRPEAPR